MQTNPWREHPARRQVFDKPVNPFENPIEASTLGTNASGIIGIIT
jgi:hypothetical protein